MTQPDPQAQFAALEAMGLPVFLARRTLPGAAPSSPRVAGLLAAAALPAAPATEASPAPVHESAGTAAPPREPPQPGRPGRPVLPRVHEPERKRAAAPGAGAAASRPPPPAGPGAEPERAGSEHFEVLLIGTGELLWLEELDAGLIAREQLSLVAAMARAATGFDGRPETSPFRWPPAEPLRVELGPGASRLALAGFVGRRIEEATGAPRLVLLGESVRERTAGSFAVPLLALPSTNELLAAPLRKAEAWRMLRRFLAGEDHGG